MSQPLCTMVGLLFSGFASVNTQTSHRFSVDSEDPHPFRFKRIISDGLRAKRFEAQRREAMIGVLVTNRMTELGMPQSVAVTS